MLSDQEIVRRKEVQELRERGINPYPAELYPVNASASDILQNYELNKGDYKNVCLAGRIVAKRNMGKASFAVLQDSSGKIQLYFKKDTLSIDGDSSVYDDIFVRLTSLGDIVGVEGYVFTTKTGTISIHVTCYTILSKTIRHLPFPKEADGKIYDVLSDKEQRYRMRYLDLIVHPEVKQTFIKRSKMMQAMRTFLLDKGYMEVETPILQAIHGGAAARPFQTHHNALDMPLFLRIANELYLKRLIVGGFDGVFEFAKDFRNEGMDRTHNPEFTVMELYVAYKDYLWMMNLVEEMVEYITLQVNGTTEVQVGENIINFQRPWKRYTMYEAIQEFTGYDISHLDESGIREIAQKLHIEIDDTMDRGTLIDEIFGEKVESKLIQPTFITDYPIEMSPLAKKHRSKPGLVERFEAICNGKEMCNAYSELNDPIDQRERFEAQLRLKERGNEEAMELDEDFLRALELGMPPTSGLGIGMDRLAMILTNSHSIQDVLFFPHMRPEQKNAFSGSYISTAHQDILIHCGIDSLEELKKYPVEEIWQKMQQYIQENQLPMTIDAEQIHGWLN